MSRLCSSHWSFSTSDSSNHVFMVLALCTWTQSCKNRKVSSLHCCHNAGCILFSKTTLYALTSTLISLELWSLVQSFIRSSRLLYLLHRTLHLALCIPAGEQFFGIWRIQIRTSNCQIRDAWFITPENTLLHIPVHFTSLQLALCILGLCAALGAPFLCWYSFQSQFGTFNDSCLK